MAQSKKTTLSYQSLEEMNPLKKIGMMIGFLFISIFSVFLLAFHGHLFWFAFFSFLLSFLGFFMCFFGLIFFHPTRTVTTTIKTTTTTYSSNPPLPTLSPQPDTAFVYQTLLKKLQENIQNVESRQEEVDKLIEESFEGSLISSSRYKQVMQNAQEVLEKNYQNAYQAVSLFGSSAPTQERLAILENYVNDSDEVTKKIDRVIEELLKLRQSNTFESGDELDRRLEELADTTVYYR